MLCFGPHARKTRPKLVAICDVALLAEFPVAHNRRIQPLCGGRFLLLTAKPPAGSDTASTGVREIYAFSQRDETLRRAIALGAKAATAY